MKKLSVLCTLILFNPLLAQIQVGNDIDGDAIGNSDKLGSSVSISSDGTILAAGALENLFNSTGAAGRVKVFEYTNVGWVPFGNDILGEATYDGFGSAVSLSSNGSIVAIGAPDNDGNGTSSGHVRVYEYNSGSWTQLGSDIDGEASYDYSGQSVSLSSDGTIVAIGAYGNDGNGNNAGHVRVYQYSSGSWVQLGSDIDGEAAGDGSGYSLSLSSDGSILAIGAPYNDGNNSPNVGHVRVYEYSSGSWNQLGSDIDGEAAYDASGRAVSLSSNGTIVAIGAHSNDGNGTSSGHVRVYEYNSGSWAQLGSDIDGEAWYDASGFAVSLSSDGAAVAVGATGNDGNGNNAGHVRVYQYSSGSWVQLGSDIDGEAADDGSGHSLSLSSGGDTVAIGAPMNDGNGTAAGHVRVYSLPQSNNTGCNELFLSEYSEGSSNNKYYEIYNPTSNAISLSGYSISLFSNGGTTASQTLTFPAGKSIAPYDVYVVANANANSSILAFTDTTSTTTYFNGDDALVLFNGTDTLDIIGIVGVDPGSNWNVGGNGATSEFTLVRKPTVYSGTTNWTQSITEWIVHPQNTWSNGGEHTSYCTPSSPYNVVNISSFNSIDTNGTLDSLGKTKWIKGLVTSIDYDTGAYVMDFYVADSTDGIHVWSQKQGFLQAPNPNIGDSLYIYGQVSQNGGLATLLLDTLDLINSGNSLMNPTIVSVLNESTESELIKLEGFNLVNPNLWPTVSQDAYLEITNGIDTILMLIDKDTDIDGTPAPNGLFDLTGIGSQQDYSLPYLSGYFIIPRQLSDIELRSGDMFSENFDGTLGPDSIGLNYNTDSNNTSRQWNLVSNLQTTGTSSFHTQTFSNDSIIFETIPFSTVGNDNVYLTFDHICKIRYTQKAYIQMSKDNGQTWVNLTGTHYQGESPQFTNQGWFNELSYPSPSVVPYWQGPTIGNSNTGSTPTNSWWASEIYDLSNFLGEYDSTYSRYGYTNCKIRFVLSNKTGTPSPASLAGWFVDNIRITDTVITSNPSSGWTANHSIPLQACTGDTTVFSFDITSPFNVGNSFYIELSNSSGAFNGNVVSTSNLLAYGVSTNNTIDVIIPDTISQGVYSVRLISTNPVMICDTISNILIGESPLQTVSFVFNGISNNFVNKDTIRACDSDSILMISSLSLNSTGSSSFDWQWYKSGIPIAGATNDSLWLIGANAQGGYYIEAGTNICNGNTFSFHFEVETYSGSFTASSQYYNPPNSITAIATGGTSYQWSADKPIFIDDVTNDTVEVALMSDSTILAVDVSYGLNCIHTHSILLMDTSTIVCDVYDTTLVIINDTNHINIYDTSYVNVYDTTYIVVYDTNIVDVFDTTYVTVYDTNYIDVFDTTYIDVFDTSYVDIFDTTYINVYDTVLVTQIDTVYLTVTDTLIIDVSLIGINPPTFEYQVLVYPNPTNSYLHVEVPQNMIGQSYSLEIKNSIGQSMFGVAMNQPLIQINFNSFGAAGSYTLSIKDSGGNVVDTRVIILQ